MKKLFLCIGAWLTAFALQAQTTEYPELLSNAGFEESAVSSFLGTTTFEDWTLPLGAAVVEYTDKIEGEQSIKMNQLTQQVNILEQEVFGYSLQPEVGAVYELRIAYKVLTSQEGEDIALDAYWNSSRDGQLEQDADVLITDWFTASDWTVKTVRTTCPEGASRFYFRVKIKKSVVVLFDDFSFRRVDADEQPSTDPWFSFSPEKFASVEADINTSVTLPALTLKQANLNSPVLLDVRGTGRAHFSLSQTEATDSETEIVITYHPTAVGVHDAMVVLEAQAHPELSQTLSLRGICTDLSVPPTVMVTPTSLPTFQAVAQQQTTAQLKLSSTGCIDYVYAEMRHIDNSGFIVSSTQFLKNMPWDVTVTFRPVKAGYYHSQLRFWSLKSDTVVVELVGNATAAADDPDSFTTSFKWDLKNPHALLIEDFETAENNFNLQLDEWQNVVQGGERPWWGYYHRNDAGVVLERSAKATGYQWQIPATERSEMWLVTPALDYKNAESRIFTMRIMGDFMFDNNDTRLSVWLVDSVPGDQLYFRELEGLDIPTASDYNGEWREFHVDLDGQEIEDVFFMAFKYSGLFGQENSVVYYIDDVSWGRTDLPLIQTDSAQVVLLASPGIDATSGIITVTTANLTEPITLSVGGNNKSKFQLSATTLPVTGGTFFVNFNSDVEGVHEAYVKLSSRGAADVYIPMAVLCKEGTAVDVVGETAFTAFTIGMELQVLNPLADYTIYDATGRSLYTGRANVLTLPSAGVYWIRCANEVRKVIAL
ncbi:MAG: choice-of-anchor J domain-containing protein [Paludibacter sp.]|nr:choice-of-anchor J domain-containing protein [Bacteroidales bacterium]MCM1069613.1 choice-of-anchor J domain-containing protein [Prevotella sp.]MCM1354259.1 choice-of-anchor J domain-containing protein [Bacteroides sp.]MCM1443098.1 choice-of-anchor J domain-containing protein [Muribaculum sp.]MCM1482333.1 choice-of-anchor J domain-containing protein [Paludibacter sp.]